MERPIFDSWIPPRLDGLAFSAARDLHQTLVSDLLLCYNLARFDAPGATEGAGEKFAGREGAVMESDVTALEALGIAIRAEADASEIYKEVASRIGNPFLQQRILVLAKEELQHKRILEEAYSKQFPDVRLALPVSQLPKEICTRALRDRLSVREVLSCAIEQERRSRDFFLAAAEKTTDLTGKMMFNFLADWEFSHQMALSAEYEMLVRYPRYFQQTTEPWKPEFLVR